MLSASFGKSTSLKKKIIILAEYIGENHNSTAYYWSQISKHLENDYHVVLIAPENEHSRSFAATYGIDARLVKLAQHNKNNLLSRLLGQARQTGSFLSAVRREIGDADLLFSGTNPIITMASLSLMKWRYRFRWLVLVHDVFPNNLVPAKVISSKGMLYKVLLAGAKKMYSSPNRLIVIGRDMKALLREKIGRASCIDYVPNWASTEKIPAQPKANNEIIVELGWQNNVVYQFFGNMGRLQGIAQILDAIALSQHDNARFLFIGCGSEEAMIRHQINMINSNCGYKKAYFFGRLDLAKNHIGLNACDVSLVTLSNNMYGLGVPSKAYFSMAANKPILYVGEPESELALLLAEHDVGWAYEPNQPRQLADKLDAITEQVSESGVVCMQPREVLTHHFSEGMALQRIKHLVDATIDL